MKKVIICFVLSILLISNAHAASVYEKGGNIFYVNNGKQLQLTSLERDKDPVLYPKGEWVYFIRGTPGTWKGEKYYPAKDEVVENGILKWELWRIKTDGSQAKLLFRNDKVAIDGPDPDYAVATIGNVQFSPDGDKVYFETPNWVTSAGLHVMNPDGSKEKLLGPGNETRIVLSARVFDDREKSYLGYIVTCQHRYFFYGGSYDWFYLFTPDMEREVAPLGDDFAFFTEVGDIIYTDHSEKTMKRSDKLISLKK